MLEVHIRFLCCLSPHPSPHLKKWWKNSKTLLQITSEGYLDSSVLQIWHYLLSFSRSELKKLSSKSAIVFWSWSRLLFWELFFLVWNDLRSWMVTCTCWASCFKLSLKQRQQRRLALAEKDGWLLSSITDVVIRNLLGSMPTPWFADYEIQDTWAATGDQDSTRHMR